VSYAVERFLHCSLRGNSVRYAKVSATPTSAGAKLPISAGLRQFCAQHFEDCGAAAFEVSHDQVEQWLAEVAQKSPSGESKVFLESIKLPELVMARACALGNERAWEQFMVRYRESLFTAAYKIAGEEGRGRELADSLYAELYGISAEGRERKSKLLYYHGRGSLEGWLRTVLAQEYVDRFRKTKRETSLDEQVEAGRQFAAPANNGSAGPTDRVDTATTEVLNALPAEDRFVLSSYFIDEHSLAQIAALMRVHESTISRRIQRLVTGLRGGIEKKLVAAGMSVRQAQELLETVDVRDMGVNIQAALQQETGKPPFYGGKDQ
jgi:RNA polymerase sigma-70 factor, ECF subfamily